MPMDTWFREIERAKTEAEIVASARDYCSLLHPRELDALPQECRDVRIQDGVDIPRVRERLSDGYARIRGGAETERLQQLMEYFSRASDRLGELRASR
jgi:hypothetical protein